MAHEPQNPDGVRIVVLETNGISDPTKMRPEDGWQTIDTPSSGVYIVKPGDAITRLRTVESVKNRDD